MSKRRGRYGYHGTRADLRQIAREGLCPQTTWVYSHGGDINALWFTEREDWASSHGAVLRFTWPTDAEWTSDSDSWLTFSCVPPSQLELLEGAMRGKHLVKKWVPLLDTSWAQAREASAPPEFVRYKKSLYRLNSD